MDKADLHTEEDPTSVFTKDEKKDTFQVTHVNIRTSIVFLILRLLLLDILATAAAIVFFNLVSSPQLSDEAKFLLISKSGFYFLILAAIKILFTLYIVFQWLNEYYEITPDRIIYKRGIFWRKVDEYDFMHVRSLGIIQSVLGRIFNYGSLSIFDRGVYKYYYINYIHNPHRYFKLLQDLNPGADIEKDITREHLRDKEVKL